MRTSNSIKNSITSLLGNIISYAIAFISQAIFIRLLGAEYLGLNGLFTNILSMLSIFELGIGGAIVYNLYKPIADNDYKKISALMNFYKKAYNIISILIFSFGLLLLPFLKSIVGEVTIDINIYYVYILVLISTVVSYIMTYKRNLIIANQQNYIINLIHMIYLVLLNIFQLLILYFTKNYYLYLIIKIICQLAENIVITIVSSRKFKYLDINKKEKLDKRTEKDIFSRVKALFFHKIGAIIVLGTDNIIISIFFGLVSVGLYTNYNMLITAITVLFGQIISSSTASVGNLLISNDENKSYNVFKKIRFLNSWISIFTATAFLVIVQPFICVWVGEEYLLEFSVVLVISFNYFQKMQRNVYNTFKDSAGIWREDKYVPLVESLINIVFSIVLLKIFGLAGVFMGTIISGLVLWCYSYPKFVYKKLFNRNYREYAKETIGYIVLFVVISIITYLISLLFTANSFILQVIINAIICIIIPNAILILIFRKTDEFNYYINLIKKIYKKLTGNLCKK